jgi:hypothetical protein
MAPGPQRERLIDAYNDNLFGIKIDDLPEEIRQDFSTLSNRMNCSPHLSRRESVATTVYKMSDDKVEDMVKRIQAMAHVVLYIA